MRPRHHSVGLQVLSADRHLLVEKPLALSVADAAALCEAATVRARVLTVGHLLLHHPAVQRTKQLLDAGALGRPLYFEAARTVTGTNRRGGSAWWTLAPHDVSLGAAPLRRRAGHRERRRQPRRLGDRCRHLRHAAFRRRTAGAPARGPFRRRAERRFSIVGSDRALSFDELAPVPTLRVSEPTSGRPGRVDRADRDRCWRSALRAVPPLRLLRRARRHHGRKRGARDWLSCGFSRPEPDRWPPAGRPSR